MIHEESKQLLIGAHLIDQNGNVRTLPIDRVPGRLTGMARHLTAPKNKVYYATMEEGLYEVDVNTLEVAELFRDNRAFTREENIGMGIPGMHGKGLYSGQGRVVYSNHGRDKSRKGQLDRERKATGCLAEWDGTKWTTIDGAGFLDVSGPGGIRGNKNPQSDPLWAIGWDRRSVILKALQAGQWQTYRLPKASHTMDGSHGYNTEWPRIGEIGSDDERLIYTHGMFWRLPTTFAASDSAGIRPI